LNDDQTFRPIEELQSLYGTKSITADKEAITYCAIGSRDQDILGLS
jgi:thiosulfate/3-mercaptopyruvate sulfurtransferase